MPGTRPGMTSGENLSRSFDTPLPIDAVLDDLARTLDRHSAAVLVAPPGAGKTTRVPLALLDEPWTKGKKIIVLEPRRIAAPPQCGTQGEDIGRACRRNRRLSRPLRFKNLARDADRSRHRRYLFPPDPR